MTKFDVNVNLTQGLNINFNESMPESTAQVFKKIIEVGGLQNFVLVGGTALSIQLNHRRSEDLDFCCTDGLYLNRNQIDNLLDRLANQDLEVIPKVDLRAQQDFAIGGDDLLDHHQAYLISGVNVDFFVIEDRKLREKFYREDYPEIYPGIKIADLKTLSHLKSNTVLKRIKSRDFFDLKILIERGVITYDGILDSMKSLSNSYLAEDYLLSRLSPKTFQKEDEGFVGLIDYPTGEEIKADLIEFFKNQEKEYKIKESAGQIPFEVK